MRKFIAVDYLLAALKSLRAFIEKRSRMSGERYFPVSRMTGGHYFLVLQDIFGSSEIIYGELELVLFLIMRGFSD